MNIILILICGIFQVINGDLERKCHNYYQGPSPPVCTEIPKTMKACSICHIINQPNVTKCVTHPMNMNLVKVLSLVPVETENLLIDFNNTWYGFLPSRPYPLNITGIVNLKNLVSFQISDMLFQFYQYYPLLFEPNALPSLQSLTKLNTFRIRLPIEDYGVNNVSLSQIVAHLPNLTFLDLSYTRGLSKKTLPHLLHVLNHSSLVHLCLRKIQLPGGEGYNDDMTSIFINKNLSLPKLGELDLSDNIITHFPPGLPKIAPNLEMLDISGNTLLDGSNMAFFFEILQHPSIRIINFNFQGRKDQPSKYIPPPIPWTKLNNASILTQSKADKKFLMKEIEYVFKCFNKISNYNTSSNISHTISSGEFSCQFIKCVFPVLFAQSECDSQTLFPLLNNTFCQECFGFVTLPVGSNLEELYLNNIHLEQSGASGIVFEGVLKIRSPNKLRVVEFRDNRQWIEAVALQNAISNIGGIKNLDNMTTIDLQNSNLSITTDANFTGSMKQLDTLNLAHNIVQTAEYCRLMPHLRILNLSSTSLENVTKYMIRNCTNLTHLDLSFNKNLSNDSLMNLSFEGVTNLTYLNMEGTQIQFLESKFVENLRKYSHLKINLKNNQLHCNCNKSTWHFTKWFLEKAKNGDILHYNNKTYYCSSPTGFIFYAKIDLDEIYKPCQGNWIVIIISVSSTTGIIGLFAVVGLLYRVRWRIKYLCFKIQQKLQNFVFHSEEDAAWCYDAFVSYCADDRFWVHDTLLKELETTYGFRLCIHYRDFPVGPNIADTIAKKMSESREIIIILSDIAVKSSWCQFELDEALVQIGRRQKSLIIITLGNDLQKNCLNARVAHVLENHTFMKWTESPKLGEKTPKAHKLFWSRLVGRLYNNPRGNSWITSCCCPYGANALGYKDIFDQEFDDEDAIQEGSEDHGMSDEMKQCLKRIQTYEKKSKQAKRFLKVVKSSFVDDETSRWAFGQLPWPVVELLGKNKARLDHQRDTFTKARTQLLLDCLQEQGRKIEDQIGKEKVRMREIEQGECVQEEIPEQLCVYKQ